MDSSTRLSYFAPSSTALDYQDLPVNHLAEYELPATNYVANFQAPLAVTAVVVTRGRTPHLAATLAAIRAQSRRPDRIALVDIKGHNGQEFADLALDDVAVIPYSKATKTVGGAITHARDLLAQHGLAGSGWLWILYDDSAPEPATLEALLRATEHSTAIAVAGCKQRSWPLDPEEPPALLEVGHSISPFGRRFTGVEPGEIDQGQFDDRDDVLAVDFAGALISNNLWEQLSGVDPAFSLAGGESDFCRRAWRSGARVVVVPSAVVYHAAAPGSNRAGRFAEALHRLIHTSRFSFLPVLLSIILGAPFLAVARLATGHPNQVFVELALPLLVLARLGDVFRSRRRLARLATVPKSVVRPLLTDSRTVFAQWKDRHRSLSARASAPVLDPLELQAQAALASRRRLTFAGVLLALLGLTALVFGRSLSALFTGSRMVGGALLPAPGDFWQAWAAATSPVVVNGLGAAAPPDPLLVILAAFTALTGSPQLTVHLILLLALPLAGVGAWFAAGMFTRSNPARVLAALTWACAPVLFLALSAGQLGNVLVHITLPYFIWAGTKAVRRRSVSGLGFAALLLAVLVAAAPALLGLAVIAALMIALLVPKARHFGFVALLPAAVIGAPLWIFLARNFAAWPILFDIPLSRPELYSGISYQVSPWQALLGFATVPAPWFAGFELAGWLGIAVNYVIAALPYLGAGLIALLAVRSLFQTRNFAATRTIAVALTFTLALTVLVLELGLNPTALISVTAALIGTLALLNTLRDPLTPQNSLREFCEDPEIATPRGAPHRSEFMLRPERVAVRRMTGGDVTATRTASAAACFSSPYAEPKAETQDIINATQWWRRFGWAVLAALPLAGFAVWVLSNPIGGAEGGVAIADSIVPTVGLTIQQADPPASILHLNRNADGEIEYTLLRSDGSSLLETSVAANQLATTTTPTLAQANLEQMVATLSVGNTTSNTESMTESISTVTALAQFGIGAIQVPAGGDPELLATLDLIPGFVRLTSGAGPALWRLDGAEQTEWSAQIPTPPPYPRWATLSALTLLGAFALLALPLGGKAKEVAR